MHEVLNVDEIKKNQLHSLRGNYETNVLVHDLTLKCYNALLLITD
jgi:hypothetical protein